jgi:hypothetical protein
MTSEQSKKIRVCRHFGAIFVKSKGAFPPSHFCNKLDDKLARKVALVSL